MKCNFMVRLAAGIFAIVICMGADGFWLKHVPEKDRQKINPYAGQPDAIQAGSRVFADHCAKCHGPDALGLDNRPSLRSDRVQHAADGEIAWLLKNGESCERHAFVERAAGANPLANYCLRKKSGAELQS